MHDSLFLYIYIYIHYNDVIMGAIASQITSLTIVYSIVYSGADHRKHQSSASLAFVRGIHRFPAQMASYAENVSIWWRHHGKHKLHKLVEWLDLTTIVSDSYSGDLRDNVVTGNTLYSIPYTICTYHNVVAGYLDLVKIPMDRLHYAVSAPVSE